VEDLVVRLSIRSAVAEDEPDVVALWRVCDLVASYNDPAADFRSARNGPCSDVLVGEDETGRISGSVMVGHDGHRGWLYYLASSPDARGLGIGRHMADAAEEWLRRRGVAKAQLLVRETNVKVVSFYEHLGYEVAPRVVMGKWLREPDGARPQPPAALSLDVRLAAPDDRQAVEGVVRAAYAPYVARIGREPGPMLDDYGALIRKGRVHVIEHDGRVQGILVLISEEDSMLLDNIAVSPDAQGRGLGRRLLAFAERSAVASGYSSIKLYTNEAMTKNIGLYSRIGYVETHRAEEKGFRRVYMAKRLS
jgi:ribosomal protein S18 acetylase RimI-like enzyme